MANETTIIVADDHPIFRQGLKQVIEKEFGFRVIAEAEDGAAALELIKTYQPMVAVLDLGHAGNGRLFSRRSGAEIKLARQSDHSHDAQRRAAF
jgi:DNA-binding NarL/FixJ family response regulator